MSVRNLLLLVLVLVPTAGVPAAAQAQRTWNLMPTGNGHGFQVFDRLQNRITYFLEHPYRFVAPGDDARTFGIGRRDLAFDIYFGARAGGVSKWLNKCGTADCVDYASVEYEAQTHIIKGVTSFGGAQIETYQFAPFGYAGNGMLMLFKASNPGGSPISLSVYAKANMKLGTGRVDPGDQNEQLQWQPSATPPHGVETGPGGGHVLYVPIADATRVACGGDSTLYNAVLTTGDIGTTSNCTANDQVFVFQKDLSIPASGEAWWGLAILFLNDNPSDARASLFRDTRSVSDILTLWSNFAGSQDAKALHDGALAEFAAWRKSTAPSGLSAVEQRLWRQSEAVLRMGQIREKARQNDGMILAALPPGEWHTGWVRDATYAMVGLALTGHTDEARRGLEFFLSADAGFFKAGNYLGRDYRVGICRYFGNGLEEGDFNQDGPNIETDGWGLMLWAAKTMLHQSCDKSWLDTTSWKGDTFFAALTKVAEDMEALQTGNLPNPDASIWEVHWDRRQVFSYTTATYIRGYYDFADIAEWYGRTDLATKYRGLADAMLARAKTALVYAPTSSFASHLGVAGDAVHVDGSTMAFLDFGLIATTDPLYVGTLNSYSKLITTFGGYRRLEPQLSLTGGGSAGQYDLSEWILLDLRIGDAWRRQGNATKANELLDKVTGEAANNDLLIPELFDADNGRYTGVVPMVGYGAGAWMMSQLVKHGSLPPAPQSGFAHCSGCASNPCTGDHEVCAEGGPGGYTCNCAPGFHRDGAVCVADTVCDAATTCSGHGTCTGVGLACQCDTGYTGPNCADCATGYHREGAACVADTACNPNPCTEPNKTQCQVQGQSALCSCDPGYVDQGGSCVAEGTPDGGTSWNDGSATLCGISAAPVGDLLLILLFAGLGLALTRRARS